MRLPMPFGNRRAVYVAVATAIALLSILAWRWSSQPALRTPSRIESHPRHEQGYYFDLAERVRTGAGEDPRLGLVVAAVYGAPAQPLPTVGVLSGVIKFGHGSEISNGVLGGLAGSGLTLGPRTAAPAGRHGGTFECGAASYGADAGTYCVWWNTGVVGMALVTGQEPVAARALALTARNATTR